MICDFFWDIFISFRTIALISAVFRDVLSSAQLSVSNSLLQYFHLLKMLEILVCPLDILFLFFLACFERTEIPGNSTKVSE